MIYVKPNYYDKFVCIADKCEDTCCAGWQIVIDDDSLERYKSETRAYVETLRSRIDWEEGVFKQDCRKRCAFLREDKLCEMYRQLGEDSLCYTCTTYPRHTEEFENIREVTLAISCPEVARIILGQQDPVTFAEEEIEEEEEEMEDFDPFFFSYLEDARKIILSILQNRAWSVDLRVALVENMAKEMQEIIETSDLFDLADVFEKYEDLSYLENAIAGIRRRFETYDAKEQFRYSKAVFGRLYELEHLRDEWSEYLEQCFQTLYADGADCYQEREVKFKEYCIKEAFDGMTMEIILEQLLVYFVFTYFCGAVYDDNVMGKIRMSVDSVTILYEMFVAKWAEQRESLSLENIQKIVYCYSRELEHSDINLEIMEE